MVGPQPVSLRMLTKHASLKEFVGRWPMIIFLFLLLYWDSPTSTAATNWGCYDAQPSHPTKAEKEAYIKAVSSFAVHAEEKYGVPAPALAAMAINESGYGFTRTALYAHNVFGFKWNSSKSAGGRASYTLRCQPSWDVGNKYIVFQDVADSVDFVAKRLSTSAYYKEDTDKFKLAMLKGLDRKVAVSDWLTGISSRYNYNPPKYVRSITLVMNNPSSPSLAIDPTNSLFLLKP